MFGELKAGKSSCLNFLLEDDVLPTDSAACTVVVTELHYGNTRKVGLQSKFSLTMFDQN